MSLLTQNKWFRRLGFAAMAAMALGAATVATAPAQARNFLSVGGITFPVGGHVHHDWWRNGGWYHDSYHGWSRIENVPPYYRGGW